MAGSRWRRWIGEQRFWRVAAVAAMVAWALPAMSDGVTIDDVTFPSTVDFKGRAMHLNGAGLRTLTVFQIHAYAAALYLENPSQDTDAIEASPGSKMLILEYLRAGSQAQVQDTFRRSAARYCAPGDCPESDVRDFERLAALFPAVKRGDRTTYLFSPRGLQVLLNNVELGTFDNPGLARRLLDAFIGPRAASESLRNALLGRSDDR